MSEKKEARFVPFELVNDDEYISKGLRLEGAADPFTLTASKDGVVIEGKFTIDSHLILQDFARVLSDMWKTHKRLSL